MYTSHTKTTPWTTELSNTTENSHPNTSPVLNRCSRTLTLTTISKSAPCHAIRRYLSWKKQSVDEEALWESLEPPLREACEKFVQTRILEGRNLEKDLIGKLDSLEEKVLRVEARSPEVVNAYRTKPGSKSFRAAGRHTDRRQPHRSRSHPVFQTKSAMMRKPSAFTATSGT